VSTRKIGRYEILRPLAEGGMGATWLARDPELDRVVVLKGLRAESMASADARERLLREARVLAGIDHPNIVHVHDLLEQDGQWFICMQQVKGRTVRELMADGPLALAQIHRIAMGIASALVAAHEAGVIHRDIKPENVMVTDDGEARVLDFGIAWRPLDSSLTATTLSLGTLMAMAPEQFAGQVPDRRSDLFAVGLLLYEMSTGRHPFQGKVPAEVAYHVMNTAPPPPTDIRADMPFELLHAVSKCLEKDPDLRYQSATELRADLHRLGRELQGGRADVASLPESRGMVSDLKRLLTSGQVRPVPALPPLPGRAALATLVALGVLAIVALVGFRPEPYRTSEALRFDLAAAEGVARGIVERQGANLYGYGAETESGTNRDVEQYARFLRLSTADGAVLYRWRAALWYTSVFVSADRQERYTVDTDGAGRPTTLRHDLRPDDLPPQVPVDSAAAVARRLLESEFALAVNRLEALPEAELPTAGGRDREFRWRLPDTLPGGAVATATVRTTGSRVVLAALGVELPKTVTRRYENWGIRAGVVWVALVILALAGLGIAVRRGRFDLPNLRFSLVALGSSVAAGLLLSAHTIQLAAINKPPGISLFTVTFVALMAFVVGGALLLVLGAVLGTLRDEEPSLVAGLADFLRLRTSRAVWARSAAMGIPLGALTYALERFFPWIVSRAGLGIFMPEVQSAGSSTPIVELSGQVAAQVLLSPILTGGGLVVIVLLRRWLRLGAWAWALVPIAAVLLGSDSTLSTLQPGALQVLRNMVLPGIIVWSCVRFGWLTGSVAFAAYSWLDTGVPYVGAHAPSLRVGGLVEVGGIVILLALALHALRPPRAAAPPGSAT
jgi:tRNA A-37 threonylcarbamoyl transferase component Bud32